MENLNSKISGVCINILIVLLLADWRRMAQSSKKSVQTFLFSSGGFGLDAFQSWVGGKKQQ